jgi:hypothetical protein
MVNRHEPYFGIGSNVFGIFNSMSQNLRAVCIDGKLSI